MKKILVKGLVLTFVLTTMTVSTAFAASNQSSAYQQQQLEQIRQQNEALKQQNSYLMQQTEMLKQQAEALKQGQVYNQPPVNVHPVQSYVATPTYTQSAVYYTQPVQAYYTPAPVYSPGPWYGGVAAGYILGQCFGPRYRCGWGHRWCH